MSLRIAFSGKGGSGKTTLAALTIHSLHRLSGKPVLAIDGDPNATLAMALGLTVDKTIAEVREGLQGIEDASGGMTKDQKLSYELETALVETDVCDLLTMGRPEGPGCYCFVNHLLRNALSGMGRQYPFVVLDNEAGMEHLSRRTTDNMDLLVLVLEPTRPGLETALRIASMLDKLPIRIGRTVAVVNKAPRGWSDEAFLSRLSGAAIPIGGTVELDEEIGRLSMEGLSLADLPPENPAAGTLEKMLRPYLESPPGV